MAAQNYERLYHEDWQDDQTMDVLFSPFRENRQVNPHSWDKKMTFWTDLIISHCLGNKCLVVNAATLPLQFKRAEKLPVCLNNVLREMLRNGKLQQLSDYQQDASNGWASWSFNALVKKPLCWSFSTLVKRPMSWGLGQLTGQIQQQEELGVLVILDLVKEKAEEILNLHYASAQHALTDNIVGYTQLRHLCRDVVCDEQSFQLAIMWLCKLKKCCITMTENQEKVVQFASKNDSAPVKMSECDLQIFRLKKAEAGTEEKVEELTCQMEICRDEAKEYLQKGLKTSAKNALRRKKKIESLRDGKETALENIRHMLRIIQQVEGDKMVLDAYASGSEAFKEITRRYGLTPDMIDNVMTDVNETLDLNEELQETISQNAMDVGEPALDELEEELEMILQGEGKTATPPRSMVAPPRRIVSPPSGMRVPHQELVNSLCQMKVLDKSVEEADMDFPAVPTFNLDTPPKMAAKERQREPHSAYAFS